VHLASADLAAAYYDKNTLCPSGNDYSAGSRQASSNPGLIVIDALGSEG
jgi:hypothetical protein